MLAPAATGSGASVFERVRTGDEDTGVAIAAPPVGAVSLLSMSKAALVITVPFARGLPTCTTSCTDPELPAFSAPRFQVTTPAARAPPPVADTKLVFPGIVSLLAAPLILALPVLPYVSV